MDCSFIYLLRCLLANTGVLESTSCMLGPPARKRVLDTRRELAPPDCRLRAWKIMCNVLRLEAHYTEFQWKMLFENDLMFKFIFYIICLSIEIFVFYTFVPKYNIQLVLSK